MCSERNKNSKLYHHFCKDVPMSVGIMNIRSQGSYTNELEFEWDTQIEAHVYIKVNIMLILITCMFPFLSLAWQQPMLFPPQIRGVQTRPS